MAIVLTKENIAGARTYLKIGAKQRLAEQIAGWVVTPVEMTQNDMLPMPPLYKENRALKNTIMMGILCRYYLQLDFACDTVNYVDSEGKVIDKQEIDYYPTMEAFDELAESAIMNQLERLKKNDKEISNIIFDFMYDFKTLEQMVNAEIKDYLAMKNDTVTRVANMFEMLVSEQNLKNLQETLENLQKELEEKSGE